MRVITGTARGHPLKVPKSAATRPTPARAKEAIFSSLGDGVAGTVVLDLFAGSGALGIEALSRGAARATFIDTDRGACGTILANLKTTSLSDRGEVLRMEIRQALESLERRNAVFDLIFADPPYYKVPSSKFEVQESKSHARPKNGQNVDWKAWLLHSEALRAVLAPDGWLLIEHSKRDEGGESPLFRPQKDFRFGDTVITLFRHA